MTDQIRNATSPWKSWPLDREVVMSRLVDADRGMAFRAWTDPEQIVQWFGPSGFQTKTYEIDIRVGGVWRFDMVAPDGTIFSNRIEFVRIEAPKRIEFIHGTDSDNDKDAFFMLVTFDAQENGKTVLTLRQMHPTPERRGVVVGFGAVEYGAQTWDKFADFVEGRAVEATGSD
jgi:uncharacterized protein YndB with AHSA1/START domain